MRTRALARRSGTSWSRSARAAGAEIFIIVIFTVMANFNIGFRSIHEIEKQRKRLEGEKVELTGALEEAEATLEQEENKVLRSQLELTQVQQEIARRIAEKEEEFMLVKKNFSKALEGMHLALETESKAKAEALPGTLMRKPGGTFELFLI